MIRFLLLALLLLSPLPLEAKALSHPVKVIATFSILGEFAKQVGGDQVYVYSLVGPDISTHDYTPTEADRISVERSDLVVSNGLGLEGWLGHLLQVSKEPVQVMQASKNVPPRYGTGGGIDPHAWTNVAHAIVYVKNIRDALIAVDPLNAQEYKDNAAAYLYQLNKLDRSIKLQMGRLPEKPRSFAISHDSFAYFGAAYGFNVMPIQGLEPLPHASASDYPEATARMKKEKITLLFSENVGSDLIIQEMEQLSGAKHADKLYTDALSADEGAATYIGMMKKNMQVIFEALQPTKPAKKSD